MIFYHGSPYRFDKLRKDSWVTSFKEDAISFGIPWSSDEVDWNKSKTIDGRPPKKIYLKEGVKLVPSKIYLYEVQTPNIQPAKTNMGSSYYWNFQVKKETDVKLIGVYDSRDFVIMQNNDSNKK